MTKDANSARLRKAEKELQKANERFRLAAAAVNSAIYDFDLETHEIFWASGITEAFGYPLDQVDLTIEWWVERIHPADRKRIHEQFLTDVVEGRDFVAEYRFRTCGGDYVDVWDRARLLKNRQGQVIRMVGSMVDITERKQSLVREQRHQAARKMLQVLMHEIYNPLTGIIGNLSLLEAEETSAEVRQCLKEIEHCAQRIHLALKELGRLDLTNPSPITGGSTVEPDEILDS